ncbi:type-2 restriction enzyme DpnI [bacterium BMS3Abin07]|nr:type-2 restriction enzyme DpnI [bacterium BMS3Abin07]HDO23004.1 hypothetical protein [Nitrospirota bacterium]
MKYVQSGGLLDRIKILKSPWKSDFIRLVKGARKSIHLASPYIKKDIALLIVDHANPNIKINYLNSFKLSNFYRGASDLEAIEILHNNNVNLKSYHQLHAKVFIFDGKKSVVTSGNLTSGGLLHNYEYGLLVDDAELSSKITDDYQNIFRDKELTGRITIDVINKASQILRSVPKERKTRFQLEDKELFKRVPVEEIDADKYEGGVDSIRANLKGWEKDVFDVLNEINLDIFKLKDVYKYEDRLKSLHPRNRYVKDKIRQQLQVLRDLGLLQFLGGGVYRKLWKG